MKALTECRKEINEIDEIIKEEFLKRMEIVKEVALYKIDNNIPVFDPIREKELIVHLTHGIDEELKPYYLEFIKMMLKISKDYQKEIINNR